MRNCEKSKVLHGAWGGAGEGAVREEAGAVFTFRKEAVESTTQFQYPAPDCQKQELSPSMHQYYFQTLPRSRPFAEFVSFSALTMKWFKQGNLYQPLKKKKKGFVFPK